MRSKSWPLRPTKGRPCRSSSAPGASPMTMSGAPATPSANTVWVAVALRPQPEKARTSASSSLRLAALTAVLAGGGAARGGGDAEGGGGGGGGEDWGEALNRSRGWSPIDSSAPIATYQRNHSARGDEVGMITARLDRAIAFQIWPIV